MSSTQTVGELAHTFGQYRPVPPLRRCGFCEKDITWGEPTSARYGQVMHAACATAFDAATRRILSQAQRLDYASGQCAWCRQQAGTLRFVNHPPIGFVCAKCRGIGAQEQEG